MWPFKRKKQNQQPESGLSCTYCGSKDTVVKSSHGSEQLDYIRVWRGQRFVTCRCLNCQREFYANEPQSGLKEETLSSDNMIDDEEDLRAAEEELKRQIEEEDDRRYKPNDSD
jgi:DNA-directed RNA polymerase subunit RPC12/RpoP